MKGIKTGHLSHTYHLKAFHNDGSKTFCYLSCLPDAIFISYQLDCAIKMAERFVYLYIAKL